MGELDRSGWILVSHVLCCGVSVPNQFHQGEWWRLAKEEGKDIPGGSSYWRLRDAGMCS